MPDAGEKTPTNIGTTGVGVFKSLLNSLWQFKKIDAGSSRITITDDVANNTVDVDMATTLAGMTLTTPTVNGEIVAQVAKTANYTMTATDFVVRCDASAGAFTITLPASSGKAGTIYKIIRTDVASSTNFLTVDGNASETIDGMLTWKLMTGESLVIMSDGTNWVSISRPNPSYWGYYYNGGSTDNRRYPAGTLGASTGLSTSTTSPTANTLYALPFITSRVTKFDIISFEVTTLVAAKSARCGIYFDNGNCYPGALLFDTGSISVATTGVKDTTITSSLQVFQPGLYWLAWETDAGATLQIRILTGNNQQPGVEGILNSNWGTASAYGYNVAHTFGTLPDPYTASANRQTAGSSASAPIPAICLRAI